MRRIKVAASEGAAVYHCVTRTIHGQFLLDVHCKEVLRKQLRQAARFSGVELLTFCLLDNHFHVLIRVPKAAPLSDAELLSRYQALYPKPTRFQVAKVEVLESILQAGGPEAEKLRSQLLSRMGDVSEFMKTVKQRFSVWYNRTHERYGTLWSERFKSVLVENTSKAVQTVAAYIDLNPVRAGLVQDPADYRWCGYAEAVGGVQEAREGLAGAVFAKDYGLSGWRQVGDRYRALLGFEAFTLRPAQAGKVRMDRATAAKMMASGKDIALPDALRCRVRYFTDGAVLGGKEFIAQWFSHHRQRLHPRASPAPKPLKGKAWEGLATYRGLQRSVYS
ncbi:MAG: transposase [Bdellovibrionaceae bacterium]|nr:transposase [Pseudobdellovibrionaceae bacterium]